VDDFFGCGGEELLRRGQLADFKGGGHGVCSRFILNVFCGAAEAWAVTEPMGNFADNGTRSLQRLKPVKKTKAVSQR
jgi:hypothetical protein